MRKFVVKTKPEAQNKANGALGTERPTQAFSLNNELFPVRKTTSHVIPDWIRLEEELYFITINCKERGSNQLCTPTISKGIFSALEFYAQKQMIFSRLVLLMPDHMHGIFSFSAKDGIDKSISTLKKYLARNYRINAVCKFFNKKSVQIVEANSHISG